MACAVETRTMTTSLQLPDLLSMCSVFELRTNRHCRGVSQASEKWLLESDVSLSSMAWGAAKPGLLAAACHPSADATQLRFIADFLSLLLHDRVERPPHLEDATSDVFLLLSDRLSRVAYKYPRWYFQLISAQRRYHEARHQLSKNSTRGVVPDLESYIALRRDASGFWMALDMVPYAGDVNVPEVLLEDASFMRLKECACDIAVWSEDILSCAKGIPAPHEANLVTILMRERNVSLECAVSTAGTLVRQSVDAFVATEDALLSVPELGR
ncbi:isoprenoid synthase domain-containing protein [Chiua virens]|nr:isoprenoid synthase domain-containing protein [Chiua virens]